MLKSDSLTKSDVGRVFTPSGGKSLAPLAMPLITRILHPPNSSLYYIITEKANII